MLRHAREHWDSPEAVAYAISHFANVDDPPPEVLEVVGTYMRMALSRNDMIQLQTIGLGTDVSPMLGTIAVPTLVLARNQDRIVPPERMRHLADQIPGAQF